MFMQLTGVGVEYDVVVAKQFVSSRYWMVLGYVLAAQSVYKSDNNNNANRLVVREQIVPAGSGVTACAVLAVRGRQQQQKWWWVA